MNGQRHSNNSQLPAGAQRPPVRLSRPIDNHVFPSDSESYTFEVTPPTYQNMRNPWENAPHSQPYSRPRVLSMNDAQTPRNETSSFDFSSARMTFPEPMLHASTSYQPQPPPRLTHHHSRSDLIDTANLQRLHVNRNPSVTSFASSYNVNDYDDGFGEVRLLHSYLVNFLSVVLQFNDHENPGELVQGLSNLS